MKERLVDKYRPHRFEDMRGQEEITKYLSQLIIRGQIQRNILLHGQVGSGKTTLARIYARALNCLKPNPKTGSPCNECEYCTTEFRLRDSFGEISVPEYETADALEKQMFVHQQRSAHKCNVIFLDEAHSLSRFSKSIDKLLQPIEAAENGVVYILATSELADLPPALKSRFPLLRVRPLSLSESRTFMQDILSKENISTYDSEALNLIAGLSNYQPRNMLHCLDQIRLHGITTEYVRRVFGTPSVEKLLTYFLALAHGDAESAIRTIIEWPELFVVKIQMIQTMLLHVYYRNLHKMNVTVDPLIASISDAQTTAVADAFCARTEMIGCDPKSVWRDMIRVWQTDLKGRTDEALNLTLAIFHHTAFGPNAPNVQVSDTPTVPSGIRNPDVKIDPVLGYRPRTKYRPRISDSSDYLDFDDARYIVNTASICTQGYGIRFNVMLTLWLGVHEEDERDKATRILTVFAQDLTEWFQGRPQFKTLCRITMKERDPERGLCARSILHLPEEEWEHFRQWCSLWSASGPRRVVRPLTIEVDNPSASLRSGPARDARHRTCILWLLNSLNPAEKAWARGNEGLELQSIRELLGLKSNARIAGAVLKKRFGTSEALGPTKLRALARNRMFFLSAFDDGEWKQMTGEWERLEHKDRINESERRATELSEALIYKMNSSFGGQSDLDEAQQALIQHWSEDAHQRPRSWTVWWSEGEF